MPKRGRPKLPPGQALTPAERSRRYRSHPKNKIKIKLRNKLSRLLKTNQVLENNLTNKQAKAGNENKTLTQANKKSNAKKSLIVKL